MFKRPRSGQKQLEREVVVGEVLAGRTEVLGARARRKHAPESVNRGHDKCYVIGPDHKGGVRTRRRGSQDRDLPNFQSYQNLAPNFVLAACSFSLVNWGRNVFLEALTCVNSTPTM